MSSGPVSNDIVLVLCAGRGIEKEILVYMSNQKQILIEQGNGTLEPFEQLRQEIVGGLLYCHSRESMNTSKTLEVTAFAYALVELLMEKGLLAEEELNERKRKVAERLVERFRESGMGVVRQEGEQDKYTFKNGVNIDCENRVHLCKAACCGQPFALSKQDVEEGIVKWDFVLPYMNARGAGGHCVHLERKNCRCTVYENRPVPCRGYDCRNDKRIWLDFEKKIINPELEKLFGNGCRLKNVPASYPSHPPNGGKGTIKERIFQIIGCILAPRFRKY